MTTGERIKEARKYRKMTQKQLAEAARVATGIIQQYELGKREPRYEILIRICKALNISILVFLLPGSSPIKYLTPEAVDDEINKRNHFGAYLESLGYELFAETDGSLGDVFSQKSSGGADGHTLIVDYNRKRLFLLDDAVYRDVLEEDIASVSEKLGHTDKAVTLRMYTHADQESIRRASQIFRNAIKDAYKPTRNRNGP